MSNALTRVCVAGGGPAGMMAGFLLARSGIDVIVLEKHADFFRDFRGDTVHPSTLEVIYELGLLNAFLERRHQRIAKLRGVINGTQVTVGDLTTLKTRCKFIAMMPQWDFLNFLAEQARAYPTFRLMMSSEVTDLIEESGRIAGVRADTPQGPSEIRATVVIGADGRHSTVRERAGLPIHEFGVPIDVLWMRLPKEGERRSESLGYFENGRVFVAIDRGDYYQCALVIAKGGFDALKEGGLRALRDEVSVLAPPFRDRVNALRDWDDVKLLTVKVDRLRRWYRPGLLCIGDAAHAMSPIGGVGINLAVQDAVATANILYKPLRDRTLSVRDLAAVQRRRMFPTQVTQAVQLFVQQRAFRPQQQAPANRRVPFPVNLALRFPFLARIPARVVGLGVRPEHVHTPNAFKTTA